jgi:DNA-binding CsgD family transcriptional regulator
MGDETSDRERPRAPSDLRVAGLDAVGPGLVVLSYALPDTDEALHALSPAERQVCRLAIEGRSNREIAEIRGTRVRTVANQMASILDKLGVTSRRELAARFTRAVRLD